MAPEMISKKGYSYSADYYSLGVIAYELSEVTTPFCRITQDENISNKILNEETAIRSNRSEEFKDFVVSLLKKNPKKRLGAVKGIAGIISHPWLKGVEFGAYASRKNSAPSSLLNLLKFSVNESGAPNRKKRESSILDDQFIAHLSGFSVDTVVSEYCDNELDEAITNHIIGKKTQFTSCDDKPGVTTAATEAGTKKKTQSIYMSSAIVTDTAENMETKEECNAKFTPRDPYLNTNNMTNYNFGKFLKAMPH